MDRSKVLREEKVHYETELARRRYFDPDNQLVADALEVDWHENLHACQVCLEDLRTKM